MWLMHNMEAGKPRTKETTLEDLHKQEKRAFGGAPSAVETLGRESGTKDKYFQTFVDELQTKANQWREDKKKKVEDVAGNADRAASASHPHETLVEMMRRIRTEMPDNIFNPVLNIPGTLSRVKLC